MPFKPEHHGFQKIGYKAQPGNIPHFELVTEHISPPEYDMLRLNIYVSLSSDFTNIWFGLLDSFMAECTLGFEDDPRLDFRQIYCEPLFRGYIQDNETGKIILEALRIEKFTPQVLSVNGQGKLECNLLEKT